ncbi:MAG: FAD-binding oxidoreductase [Solirubrobacterales bacterium]
MRLKGNMHRRGEEHYEEARLAATWNERKPDRFPASIVLAEEISDVQEAVRFAAAEGLQVKARSGGHSWTASSIRDDTVLIDLSRISELSFDEEKGIAIVAPGSKGRDLNAMLDARGLFFPSGHCPSVGLGGFLLQGGWGWLSRAVGPACMSVVGVDVVTADGELIHADEEQNTDYLWAARGSGAGYFGVVTRFYLRTHHLRRSIFESVYAYPMDVRDQLLSWVAEIEPELPAEVEVAVMGTTPRHEDGSVIEGELGLVVMASVMMDDEEDARAAIGRLDEFPLIDRATERRTLMPRTFVQLYDGPDSLEPEGFRWAADGMWTDNPVEDLLPEIEELFTSVPSSASHVFWYPWREQQLDNAAISVQGKLYVAAFAGWTDPAEDDRFIPWPAEQMGKLEHLSKGIQLADENLVARPARFLSPENEARLEELRARYDPDSRFAGYLIAAS